MRILVACEESQAVTIEMRRLGHEAYSCDIQECSGGHPEWHIQGDVLKILNPSRQVIPGDSWYGFKFRTMDGILHCLDGKWDMIIAHPPCTYLSNAGNDYFNVNKYGVSAVDRWKKRIEAAAFFMKFVEADCERKAIENPVGYMNSHYRKADQTIHPYFFAESEEDKDNYHMKRTCLWLFGLPKLQRTSFLPEPLPTYIDKTQRAKKRYFTEAMHGSHEERQKARSKTFPGIAKSMAEQWAGDARNAKEDQ